MITTDCMFNAVVRIDEHTCTSGLWYHATMSPSVGVEVMVKHEGKADCRLRVYSVRFHLPSLAY